MFKDVLKKLRESRGLTQEQLADALGVKPGAIGNYEQGKRLPKNDIMWVKIAQYFNVTVDYLMDVGDEIEPHYQIPAQSSFTYAMLNETKDLTAEHQAAILSMVRTYKEHLNK